MKHYVLFPVLAALAALWVAAVRRYLRDARAASVLQWLPLPFFVVYMWRASQPARLFNDFKKAYYPAGELVRRGDADRLFVDFPPAFTNIPIVAWLFVPLTAFTSHTAGIIFTVLGAAAVIAAVALLARYLRLTGARLLLFVGAVAASGPLYNSLREGNTTHAVWLALVAALILAESKRNLLAGVLIGLAAIIKPPLALVAIPFLLRGRWETVTGMAVTVAAVVAASFALYGADLHRDWYETSVEPFSRHPLGASSVQSLDAVLARLLTGDKYIADFEPIRELGTAFWIARASVILALAAIGAGVCLWRRTGETRVLLRQEFCLALAFALIAAPTSWAHYYLLLLLPVALALAGGLGLPDARAWWLALALAVALMSPPVVALDVENEAVRQLMSRAGYAHYFLGGLLLSALVLAARITTARPSAAVVGATTGSARLAP